MAYVLSRLAFQVLINKNKNKRRLDAANFWRELSFRTLAALLRC